MEKSLIIKKKEIGVGCPLICIPIMASEQEEIVREAATLVAQGIDMVEWRVDAFSKVGSMNSIRNVLEGLAPVFKNTILVYTYRSKAQGGLGMFDVGIICDIHEAAAETQIPDFVDMEYFTLDRPEKHIRKIQKQGVRVIASHHDFEETPERKVIRMILEQIKDSGADVVKLAVMPQGMRDVFHLMEETYRFHEENPNIPLITMAMGTQGTLSRIAGEYIGSCVTFGAGEQSSAPGQLPKAELAAILDSLHKCLKA